MYDSRAASVKAQAACPTSPPADPRVGCRHGNGMTESQVKFVMGTPLISDTFYPNRWDYFTSVTQGENSYTNQKITLYFKDNKLVSWEGEIDTPN